MVYVLFFLCFLYDVIILQPIKILVSLLISFLWNPDVDETTIKTYRLRGQFSCVYDKWNLYKNVTEFKTDRLARDGDGFKWLCVLLGGSASIATLSSWRSAILDLVESYITDQGIIGRFPLDNKEERVNASNFSGDMLSGMLFWLAREFQSNSALLGDRLTLKRKLIDLFENTTFSFKSPNGYKKHPLCFVHAKAGYEEYDSTSEDRGFIYRLYGLGPDVIRLLAWLAAGYTLTGKKKYYVMYLLCKIGYYPLLMTSCGDYGIFYKRTMLLSWYTCNSNMYCLASLRLFDPKFGLITTIARRLKNRMKWNGELSAIWYGYFAYNGDYVSPSTMPEFFPLLWGTKYKGTMFYTGDFKSYFNVKGFKRVNLAPEWLPPEYLGHEYVWENNLIKPQTCNEERSSLGVDFVSAILHVLQRI